MERITYRITLDAHRNGIQRTIQGFETADGMARRVAINLVAGGDTFELPMTNVVALMYVTTPTATTPSINECVIEGNTIIYDVEQIVEEGITEMQLKLIETSVEGASRVLISPRFAVEVTNSNTNDGGAIQSPQFTALENALAKAEAVYNSRVTKIEILEDFTFMVYYADGTVYSSDILKITLNDGNVKMAKSWAVGGEGIRNGEDTNNSKYYSILSEASSVEASNKRDEVKALTDEARMYSAYTVFDVDFEKGILVYDSSNYEFDVDEETGNLVVDKGEDYTPEKLIGSTVDKFISEKSASIDDILHSESVRLSRVIANLGYDDGEWTPKSYSDYIGGMWDDTEPQYSHFEYCKMGRRVFVDGIVYFGVSGLRTQYKILGLPVKPDYYQNGEVFRYTFGSCDLVAYVEENGSMVETRDGFSAELIVNPDIYEIGIKIKSDDYAPSKTYGFKFSANYYV